MNYYLFNYGLTLLAFCIVFMAQMYINFNYKKYSRINNKKGISGSEVAREILKKNGLENVYVVEVAGKLTDHYDPTRKVIRLSHDIYNGETISSVAVAAHECGHAIQDKEEYLFMRIRAMLIPVVNISTKVGYIAIVLGIILEAMNLIWIGIMLEIVILLFQLITLPVEIDASKRALKELEKNAFLDAHEMSESKKMLISAALTYVASVASSLIEILRLILIYGNRNERR